MAVTDLAVSELPPTKFAVYGPYGTFHGLRWKSFVTVFGVKMVEMWKKGVLAKRCEFHWRYEKTRFRNFSGPNVPFSGRNVPKIETSTQKIPKKTVLAKRCEIHWRYEKTCFRNFSGQNVPFSGRNVPKIDFFLIF